MSIDEKQTGHSAGFRLVSVEFLQALLHGATVCRKCKYGKLAIKEDVSRKMGLASLFVTECQGCSEMVELYTSPTCEGSKGFEINRRAVLGALEIGGGKTSLQKLCAYLNMPSPTSEDTYANV